MTDFDCWHPDHDSVTVEAIIRVLLDNAGKARGMVKKVVPKLHADAQASDCSCRRALEHALVTAPEVRDPELVKRLGAVAGRVL